MLIRFKVANFLSFNEPQEFSMIAGKTRQKSNHVISDECVSCGTCEAECPVGAISQGADHYEIDADTCVDCGACASVCPTGAISEG